MPMVQGVLLLGMKLLDHPDSGIFCAQPYTLSPDSQLVFPDLRKFETWEGAGHFLMMESPDRFNRALEDFLAGM
jgi:pimeloyl-ACP methyl ester carboxylesterase